MHGQDNGPTASLLDDELGVPADATILSLNPSRLTTSRGHSILLDQSCCLKMSSSETRQRSIRIGRQQSTADIRIQHSSISRRHAILYYMDNRLFLKSFGNTMVNGIKQAKNAVVQLEHGDTLQFGTLRENIFTVEQEVADKTHNGQVEQVETSKPMVAMSEEDAQQFVSAQQKKTDQERLEQAGKGLSGRDKRQAEIQSMMASLEETPAYTQTESERQHQVQQDKLDEADQASQHKEMEMLRMGKTLQIPISRHFIVTAGAKSALATCLAVDPAGARFIVGGRDNAIRLYDFGGMDQSRNSFFQSVNPEAGYAPVHMAYSPTGDRFIVATGSLQPMVFDRNGQTLVKCVRGDVYVSDPTKTIGHTAAVTSVQWHPQERDLVASASLDGSVRLWDLARGKRQFEMLVCGKVFPVKNQRGHRTAVTSLCFHPVGREFVVGTACGSIQIWDRARVSARPERAVYHAHGPDNAIASVTYSLDGTKLVSRSGNDDNVKVWEAKQIRQSTKPIAVCGQATTVHEECNAAFDPSAKNICLAVSRIADPNQKPPTECGFLKVYNVQPDASKNDIIRSPILVVPLALPTGGTVVYWHRTLHQIFVGCSNGQAIVFCDPKISSKGAVAASQKAGKGVDALEELLRVKKPKGSSSGVIVAPLHREDFNVRKQAKRKRTKEQAVMEPERPSTGKHKTGGQIGGVISFQQFVADQRIEQSKSIAGKDPREALAKYKDGKSFVEKAYEGNESKLAEKTAEQEEEELDQT